MIILGIILSVFAIGFFCWLLFTLAVYALPFYIGLIAAFAAFHHGYSLFGSALIAIIVAASVLALGQLLFAAVRMPLLRACIALVFAIPAAVAGYHATLGIAHICIPADTSANASPASASSCTPVPLSHRWQPPPPCRKSSTRCLAKNSA